VIPDSPLRVAKIREGVRIKVLSQGTVVLSFRTGQAFEVNGSGAEILQHLSKPLPLRELVVRVSMKYEMDADEIVSQIVRFLEECSQLDLVEVSPELAHPGPSGSG
jgi:hypothetical protein